MDMKACMQAYGFSAASVQLQCCCSAVATLQAACDWLCPQRTWCDVDSRSLATTFVKSGVRR